LNSLQPQVKSLAFTLSRKFEEATGTPLVVVEGYRSPEEQTRLYEQGRSLPGNIVTWVKSLMSFHNYGLAFDLVPEVLRDKPGWDPKSSLWRVLGTLGEQIGLTWGGRWGTPDKPHFEFHPGLTIVEIKNHFLRTGEVLLSKILRPEILLLLLGGVFVFYQYFKRKVL